MITAHNDNHRTPEEHRAAVAAWAATAPSTDGKIWGRAAKPKSPRHAHLADEFRPLLKWIALWQTVESDPVQSSWMAGAHMVLDRDEDDDAEPTGPSNEGAEDDWLPKGKTAAERLLAKMLTGVVMEERPESLIRRDADGSLQIVETRTRLVIVGGDIEKSPFSRRLVRAGDVKFNDGPSFTYISVANDNYEDNDDADGLVAVDRFTPTPADLQHGDDDLQDDEEEAVAVEDGLYWDGRVPAGSVRGFRHTFGLGNQIVVPLKTKLRFTERKSAPPPPRDILTVEQRREAKDILSFAVTRLKPEAVALLDQYRAKSFEQFGKTLGAAGKAAERHGQDALRAACAEWAALLAEYDILSEAA